MEENYKLLNYVLRVSASRKLLHYVEILV